MRAAQETCSRAGSIVDPDAIIHPGPANAATTAAAPCERGSDECCAPLDLRPPSEAEKSSRDGPCEPPNTRQREGSQEAAGSAREKPANAFGRGLKLFMNPAEALEHNSIARVCREKQDLARGEKLSSAPTRAEKMAAAHHGWTNCNSRL